MYSADNRHFNVAHIESVSHIYGPGKRFVIWFQGCALACEGCWNREMWSFKPKHQIERSELLAQILATEAIEGVTFLGGEPLHQAENLWWLIKQLRARTDLTIFLFTGYEEEELQQLNHRDSIDTWCDMIAIGRYDQQQRNVQQQWIGSNNQKLLYPSSSRIEVFPTETTQIEIILKDDESVRVLGFPDDDFLDQSTKF
ncbi:4Fe-4S single cluster domain-containing protein [Vibrio sp. PNB22_8_1]|uniref:4Fe-4S single cluster domain-containing protein n=1 Tax=unclassified Vibrio TaxID=2614977 RepID=UPI00406A354C